MANIEFEAFPKIPRWQSGITITEKIDGTNAAIIIGDDYEVGAQSRNRLITPESDNFGFARWVHENAEMLKRLGPGRHFGEWWGAGIQRRYSLDHKVFSLFNTKRWAKGFPEGIPSNVSVVPVLYEGPNDGNIIKDTLEALRVGGSVAAPGFADPEGIMIFQHNSRAYFKWPFADAHKGESAHERTQ